mmetsp:Transcript_459/g.2170  ORF Transcript_459/g.2170 Transcript_459/m.2170 type:complete len:246 (+) Transcript_459:499-1236(+)
MAKDAAARASCAVDASANPTRCASHARSDARSLARLPTALPNPGKVSPRLLIPSRPPFRNVDEGYHGAVTGWVGCAPPHRPCLGTLGTPPVIRAGTRAFGPPRRVASWSFSGAKDETHGGRVPTGNIPRARSSPAMRARNFGKSSLASTAPYRVRYQRHSSNARSTAARSHATSRSCSRPFASRSARETSTARLASVASKSSAFSSVVRIERALPSITASFSRSSRSMDASFVARSASLVSARRS